MLYSKQEMIRVSLSLVFYVVLNLPMCVIFYTDQFNKFLWITVFLIFFVYYKIIVITETPIEPGVLNISRRTSSGLCPICDLNINKNNLLQISTRIPKQTENH
jgi:hypothetical protein